MCEMFHPNEEGWGKVLSRHLRDEKRDRALTWEDGFVRLFGHQRVGFSSTNRWPWIRPPTRAICVAVTNANRFMFLAECRHTYHPFELKKCSCRCVEFRKCLCHMSVTLSFKINMACH